MKIPHKMLLQEIPLKDSSDLEFKDFMKHYKDYTKEPFLFLVKNTMLPSDNLLKVVSAIYYFTKW